MEIDREEEREDSQTRLPCLSLRLVFAGGALGMVVKLGGKNYKAAGAVVSASQSGTELTSVGEETPFALRDVRREYQVELRGIDTDGLERMAVFTAELGGRVYTGCRWKALPKPAGVTIPLFRKSNLTGHLPRISSMKTVLRTLRRILRRLPDSSGGKNMNQNRRNK